MRETRQYHSSALLLPDGRLLSAGGGVCERCDEVGYLAKNAEVFSPPYLFKHDGSGDLATRPEIRSAPKGVGYEDPFSITTSQAGSISKVALVKLGAVTHSNNMEQRYVPLSFELDDGQSPSALRGLPRRRRPATTCSSRSTPRASRRRPRWSR